jgi:RepB DNA-primase from phage plasmid
MLTAGQFIEGFFGVSSTASVFICSLPNNKGNGAAGEIKLVGRDDDMSRVDAFVQKYDRAGRGSFFCVNTVRPGQTRRAKDTIAEIAALHADIDVDKVEATSDEIKAKLSQLQLLPSKIVFSGNGFHAYWLLSEAVSATPSSVAHFEQLLRQLADYVGGDPAVCEASRLMRLPTSHNTKRDAWTEVSVIADNPHRYQVFELEDWLNDYAVPVIRRKQAAPLNSNPFLDVDLPGCGEPIDVAARLRAMRYQGAGDTSIHQTQLAVSAAMLNRGRSAEDAVDAILEATRIAAGEHGAHWNWDREAHDIRAMCTSWLEKKLKADDPPSASAIDETPQHSPRTLAEVHAAFRKWLGKDYDVDTIDAALATAAAERLAGDPLWLLVISGPGNAKTETVQSLSGAGAHVTSTITSEGALLSASPRRECSKKATGGLLRKIGDRGVLVIKDVTSILSADRNTRASVLAAVREIYDGRWERNVGTDGGQTLTWTGRIAIVGAVTTAWDAAHSVMAVMGDRFVLIRSDSSANRVAAGTKAIRNTGAETAMRAELAAVVGGVIGHIDRDGTYELQDDEIDRLIKAADIVTFTRTAMERDFKGDVINAHAPEMPTRFAKQLAQMVRGSLALGMNREAAMRLALRCARDSVPPLRIDILLDLASNPGSRAVDVSKRVIKPYRTIRRELEALHTLDQRTTR